MKAERFVLPPGMDRTRLEDDSAPVLDEVAAFHLLQVARIGEGDRLRIGDGSGAYRPASVLKAQRRELTLSWCGPVETVAKPCPELLLLMAVIDHGDMRRSVEGAVEAGIDKIVLFRARRSNRPVPAADASIWANLQKIVRGSSEQSRRYWLPGIEVMDSLEAFFSRVDALFFADPSATHPGATSDIREQIRISQRGVAVAIGPEGGWVDEEMERFCALGGHPLGLGETVLRARTASVVAAHHLQMARLDAKKRD